MVKYRKGQSGKPTGMEQPSVSGRSQLHNRRHRNRRQSGIAIPERGANPDVFASVVAPGLQPAHNHNRPGQLCTSRTANAIYRTATNTIRTIYYFRTTSATGSATGSSTTAGNPVSSTGTDATGTNRRKAMDATGSATATDMHRYREAARTYEEREYLRQPQEAAMYNFDKDCEDDREMLREDPYAEYPDFPKECRMTDMAQMDMVYC